MSPFPVPFQPLPFSFLLPQIDSLFSIIVITCMCAYISKHNLSTSLGVPCVYMISGLATKHLAGSSLGEVIFPSLSSC